MSIFGFYTAYYAQPKKFSEKLLAVVNEQQTLASRELKFESLAEQEKIRVLAELSDDLSSIATPDPNQAATLLLAEATPYLDDAEQTLNWLNATLPIQFADNERWQLQRQSLTKWIIQTDHYCLNIERHGRWRLAAITTCQ